MVHTVQAGYCSIPFLVGCIFGLHISIRRDIFKNIAIEIVFDSFLLAINIDGFIFYDFDFSAVSSRSKIVNANRVRLHMLAYNLFNWFKRLVLPANMRKLQADTIRIKLIKIATRAVHSARYITFKLCSSCPYKDEFYETLENIRKLQPKLE